MSNQVNQICAFAETVPDFLYSELQSADKSVFEKHLQTCVSCAVELQSFDAVRSSIAEWRALDFDALEMPAIKIPYEPKIRHQNVATLSMKNESWQGKLRGFLAYRPAFTIVAALLFLTVCAGLIVYNFAGGESQIALDKSGAGATTANESLAKENAKQSPALEANNGDKIKKYAAAAPRESIVDKANTERKALKISTAANRSSKQEIAALKVSNPNLNRKTFDLNLTAARNDSASKTRRVPKLSNIGEEQEEASLRLTDLLDAAEK